MKLKDVIIKRRSVRKFRDTEISDDVVKDILKLAGRAPSAGNLKSYETIVTREKIIHIEAPVYLVICALPNKSATRYGERGKSLYSIQDATIFASYIQLIAVDMELSSVWVGAFRESKIKKMLKIGEYLRPVAIICLGFK